jgi:hypothetical protein
VAERRPANRANPAKKSSEAGAEFPKKLTYKENLPMADIVGVGHSCNIGWLKKKPPDDGWKWI